MRWLGIIVAALALAACGSSRSGQESASAANERQFGFLIKGQWGRDWDELVPAQQADISRDAFIACNQSKSIPFDSAKAVEEFDEAVDVPGMGHIQTRAVTTELHAGDKKQSITTHEINVDGHWRWTTGQKDVDAYKAGTCP